MRLHFYGFGFSVLSETAPLSKARVRELFDYDPETGLLTWRQLRRGRFGKPGDEAGSVDRSGHIRVGMDGKVYSAARLVYLHRTGILPTRIIYLDGNPQNLRWDNLADIADGYSLTKSARAARERRSVREEALKLIRSDAVLRRDYQLSPADSRSVMRTVCAHIRRKRRNDEIDRAHGLID